MEENAQKNNDFLKVVGFPLPKISSLSPQIKIMYSTKEMNVCEIILLLNLTSSIKLYTRHI